MADLKTMFERIEGYDLRNEIIDRISSLTIDCPECEIIIYDDEQYQCGTCNGGSRIYVLDWIIEEINNK